MVVFWDVVPTSGASLFAGRIYYAVWNGTNAFGAPVLFFDSDVTDFPNDDGTGQNDMFFMSFGTTEAVTPLAIACPVAPLTATVGVLFTSDAPIVTGGTAPFTFTLLSGPPWMTIDPLTGVVSGIPTVVGSFTYEIEVTDSLGAMATVTGPCPLTVTGVTPPPPPPFCIINPTPGTSPTVVAYDEPLELQGS